MTPQRWALLFACAAVIAVVTAVLAWRRRRQTPAATALAVTMAGVAGWSGADALLQLTGAEVVRQAYPAILPGLNRSVWSPRASTHPRAPSSTPRGARLAA